MLQELCPAFTGAVLSWTTWPWLFLVNVPLGLLAYGLCVKSLPDNPTRVVGRRFDFKEALLNALSFGLLIGSLEALSHDAAPWMVAAGFLLSAAVVTVFLRNQRRKAFPIFPLDLMQHSVFSISLLTGIVSFASQMLILVGMPFLLVNNFHFDMAQIGLVMTAYPFVILFAAPLSGYLISRMNPTILCCIGLFFLSVSNFLLSALPSDSTFWDIIWRLGLSGASFAFFQSPNNHILISSVPNHRAGGASGMMAVARLIGQTSGAACVALFFHLFQDQGPADSMFLGGILSVIAFFLSLYILFKK